MIAILDPFSGIAGDMTLGALLDLGLDPEWLRALPATLGLEGIVVRIERVKRGEIASWKVDFDIPPQPHEAPSEASQGDRRGVAGTRACEGKGGPRVRGRRIV